MYRPHAVYSKSHCVLLNIISGKLYLQHRNQISRKQFLMVTPLLENVSYFLLVFFPLWHTVLLRLSESKDKTKRCYFVYLTVPAHRKDCEQHSNWNQRILLLPELSASHQPGK